MSRVDLSLADARLKAATRDLIAASGGTDGAGATIGVRQQRMSDCQNPFNPDFLRINEVAALEDLKRAPIVTRALAKRQGYALVQLPDASAPETIWSLFVAKLAREGGDVMSRIAEALVDDNDISPGEAGAMLGDADELVDIAVQIQNALRARAEGK